MRYTLVIMFADDVVQKDSYREYQSAYKDFCFVCTLQIYALCTITLWDNGKVINSYYVEPSNPEEEYLDFMLEDFYDF